MQNRILTAEIIDKFRESLYRDEKSKNTIEYMRDIYSRNCFICLDVCPLKKILYIRRTLVF